MKNLNLAQSPISKKSEIPCTSPRVTTIETIPYQGSILDWMESKKDAPKSKDVPSDIESFSTGKEYKPSAKVRSARKGVGKLADQYGLPGKTVVNGKIVRESTWKTEVHPDYWEAVRMLCITPVNQEDVRFLESIFPDLSPEIGRPIPGSKMLSAKGVDRALPLSMWDPRTLVSPKVLLSLLIIHRGRSQRITSEVKFLAARLKFRGVTPNLVRVGIDVCRINHLAVLKPVVTLKQSRVIGVSPNVPRYNKTTWIEPTEENKLIPVDSRLTYSSNLAAIQLIPLKNNGRAICGVRMIDKRAGSITDLGTICHRKGKLFFDSPLLLADQQMREQRDKISKEYSGNREQYQARCDRLKSEISKMGIMLTQLRSEMRLSSIDNAFSIAELERSRREKQDELSRLNAPDPILKTDLNKIDCALVSSVLTVFKTLGIYPNQPIKALNKKSPLRDPDYWESNFFVKVLFPENNDRPVEFLKDLRK